MDGRAAGIVERELGEHATLVGRFEDGLKHATYEVRADGTDYVLQVADPEAASDLRCGLGCYRLLADTAIPVPDPVTERGRECDSGAYTIVEKLPGSNGERDISPARTRDAGRWLARIHEAATFAESGWPRFDDGVAIEPFAEGRFADWRHRKVQDNADYLQDGGLPAAGRAVERLFDRERFREYDPDPPVLCHNDFSPDNVLFRGEAVSGIVDFDHAYAGPRYRDVVKAANGFRMHAPTADWPVRESFYEGYRTVADLGEEFEAMEPHVRVETLAVGVGGMARMDELSEFEQEFYEERILRVVDRIPA